METRAINTKHAGVIYWPDPAMTAEESVEAIVGHFAKLTHKQLGDELSKPNFCFSKILHCFGPIMPKSVYNEILDAAIICAAVSGALEDKADE